MESPSASTLHGDPQKEGWREQLHKFGVKARISPAWSDGPLDPAVIVVDVVPAFLGERHGTGAANPTGLGAGSAGDESVREIAAFLAHVRALQSRRVPVIFTKPSPSLARSMGGTVKHDRLVASIRGEDDPLLSWTDTVCPTGDELIISKGKPSAFFSTHLANLLVRGGHDAVVIVGCTTSGCVRATVTDAFSYGFMVYIPEECVFDSNGLSGLVALHDMDRKYADVMPWRSVLELLKARRHEAGGHHKRLT